MGTTVLLSQLSAATELLIIDLVTQQDPEPDSQLSCGGYFRLSQTRIFITLCSHNTHFQITVGNRQCASAFALVCRKC